MTKVTTADLVRYHLTGERVIGIDGSVKRIVRQNNEDEDMSEDSRVMINIIEIQEYLDTFNSDNKSVINSISQRNDYSLDIVFCFQNGATLPLCMSIDSGYVCYIDLNDDVKYNFFNKLESGIEKILMLNLMFNKSESPIVEDLSVEFLQGVK